jgi:hypothetical protein
VAGGEDAAGKIEGIQAVSIFTNHRETSGMSKAIVEIFLTDQ